MHRKHTILSHPKVDRQSTSANCGLTWSNFPGTKKDSAPVSPNRQSDDASLDLGMVGAVCSGFWVPELSYVDSKVQRDCRWFTFLPKALNSWQIQTKNCWIQLWSSLENSSCGGRAKTWAGKPRVFFAKSRPTELTPLDTCRTFPGRRVQFLSFSCNLFIFSI